MIPTAEPPDGDRLGAADYHGAVARSALDAATKEQRGDPGGVFAALRVRWLVVLLATLLGAMAGVTLAVVTPKTYVATATVLLRWIGPDADTAQYSNMQYVNSRTQTYAALAERQSVLQDAIDEGGLNLTVGELRGRIEALSPRDSQLVQISASSRDRAVAVSRWPMRWRRP